MHSNHLHAPLLPPLLGFAAGIACAWGPWQPDPNLLWPGTLLAAALLGWATWRCPRPAWPWLRASQWALLFLCCGLLYAKSFTQPLLPEHHLARLILQRQETGITGRLIAKPTSRPDSTQILLDTTALLPPGSPAPVPAVGLARLTINTPQPLPLLIPGQYYQARAFLAPPHSFGTPGAFDHAAHLATDDILISGFVASPLLLRPVASETDHHAPASARFFLERFRQRFGSLLAQSLDPQRAAIYQALLIGDYGGISQETMELFKATGTIHLLAISGSHLTVVAAMVTILLLRAIRAFPPLLLRMPGRKIALGASLPLLILYTGMASFQPPVVRALLMVGVFIVAMVCNRQWTTMNNLAIAAFILLLWNPLDLRTASFQLSMAATAAIVLIMPRLHAWQASRPDSTLTQKAATVIILSLLVSLAASLATAPLTLFHFNRLSLAGPLATLLLTPPLCLWSLPLGLLAMASLPLAPTMAALLVKMGAMGIDLSVYLATLLAELPFASLWLPTPPLSALLLALLLVVPILLGRTPRHTLLLLSGFALLLSGYVWPPDHEHTVRVSCLDVGQGSATVVQLPDNTVTLIDGGGPSSDAFDVGERVIAPFLWHNRIRAIDQVIVTHAHADHYNGLPFVIRRFHPKTLWVNDAAPDDPLFRQLLTAAAEAGCQVRVASQGDLLAGGQTPANGVIRCVANLARCPRDTPSKKTTRRSNPNSMGMVVRLEYGDNAFLFPGDIERENEEQLLKEGRWLRAEALLLPHHGLKSSDSPGFLAAVAPTHMIASTGREDRVEVKAPAPESGRRLFVTARDGSVFLESDGRTITASTWRDAQARGQR